MEEIMRNKVYFITSLIIAALVFLSLGSLKNFVKQYKMYSLIAERSRLVHSLKPQLADLENRLWGIISVYDPSQGRKVDLDELKHSQMILQMMNSIESAAALTKNNQLVEQLGILERSVKSLSNRMDTIKDRLDMKKMDEESAQMLFPDAKRVYLLSESYVDELKTVVEQIRLVKRVIEDNISKYDEIEMQNLEAENKAAAKINKQWFLINVICLLGVVILGAILFRTLSSLKAALPKDDFKK
jgi:DnaJ-domain-containing protein 1